MSHRQPRRPLLAVVTLVVLVRMRLLVLVAETWKVRLDSWREMLQVGLPAMLTNAIVPVSNGVAVSMIAAFGVDAVAAVIRQAGYLDFLAEIGGEVVASGVRKDKRPWVVGISRPVPGAAVDAVHRALSLSNAAMATSGDYRIFMQIDDRYYSHILDPRSGWPVSNGVVSATVVAANCTVADGLATALMVMGPKPGVALINRLAGRRIAKTGNERFVYDAYRRLITMYADVVMEKAEGIEPAAACQMTLVTPLTDDPDMRETLEAAVATFFVS